MLSLVGALDHELLFKPFFKGVSWDRWRVFLKALFAVPMTDAEHSLYVHHTGRPTPPEQPFREACLVVGRRGGKSRVLGLIAVYLAAFFEYEPYLAPGEIATVAVIAADRKQARVIFYFVIGLLRGVPALNAMIVDATREQIRLNNRVVIEIHTASFRVTRGYTFAAVLCDESAFWKTDEGSANPDIEIIRALRPGLATIPGAMLLIASSPYRKAGVLYSTFRSHFGRDDAPVLVWRGTSLEMNPSLDPRIVAEAYATDPAAAAAEFGGEFRDDVGEFVSREVIEACTVRGRVELAPQAGKHYVAFCDPSGGSTDSMTLGIAHADGPVAVLDLLREFRPHFSPDSVVAECAMLLKYFHIGRVTGDRYGGGWPPERFQVHGIQYEPSERVKSDLYRDVLPLLNSGRAELLDLPRLAAQFAGLERRTVRGGRDSIDHPAGGHDDLANAAAGALLLTVGGSFTALFTPAMVAEVRRWAGSPRRGF
jgi:hypothetical protein